MSSSYEIHKYKAMPADIYWYLHALLSCLISDSKTWFFHTFYVFHIFFFFLILLLKEKKGNY